jgi:hypothetical protein
VHGDMRGLLSKTEGVGLPPVASARHGLRQVPGWRSVGSDEVRAGQPGRTRGRAARHQKGSISNGTSPHALTRHGTAASVDSFRRQAPEQ